MTHDLLGYAYATERVTVVILLDMRASVILDWIPFALACDECD
jgi:hypothetical protein